MLLMTTSVSQAGCYSNTFGGWRLLQAVMTAPFITIVMLPLLLPLPCRGSVPKQDMIPFYILLTSFVTLHPFKSTRLKFCSENGAINEQKQTNKQTPWPLVRERTIPTDEHRRHLIHHSNPNDLETVWDLYKLTSALWWHVLSFHLSYYFPYNFKQPRVTKICKYQLLHCAHFLDYKYKDASFN
jgi:hypothetical protein